MNEVHLKGVVEPMIGKKDQYHRAWRGGCIAVGLGELANRHPRCDRLFYAEWEIRTYQSSWRTIENGEIVIAGNDDSQLVEEYMKTSDPVDWGRFSSATQLTRFDTWFRFDSGICLDMLGTVTNSCAEVTDAEIDDSIEVFHPNQLVYLLDLRNGWMVKPYRSKSRIDGFVVTSRPGSPITAISRFLCKRRFGCMAPCSAETFRAIDFDRTERVCYGQVSA